MTEVSSITCVAFLFVCLPAAFIQYELTLTVYYIILSVWSHENGFAR